MSRVSKVVLEVDEPPKNELSSFDRLWNFLLDRGQQGVIYSECYDELPDLNPRQIRYLITDFEVKNMVTTDHSCRCGRCTVYIANPKAVNRLIYESNPKSNLTKGKTNKRTVTKEIMTVSKKHARTNKTPTNTRQTISYSRKYHVPKGSKKLNKGK